MKPTKEQIDRIFEAYMSEAVVRMLEGEPGTDTELSNSLEDCVGRMTRTLAAMILQKGFQRSAHAGLTVAVAFGMHLQKTLTDEQQLNSLTENPHA